MLSFVALVGPVSAATSATPAEAFCGTVCSLWRRMSLSMRLLGSLSMMPSCCTLRRLCSSTIVAARRFLVSPTACSACCTALRRCSSRSANTASRRASMSVSSAVAERYSSTNAFSRSRWSALTPSSLSRRARMLATSFWCGGQAARARRRLGRGAVLTVSPFVGIGRQVTCMTCGDEPCRPYTRRVGERFNRTAGFLPSASARRTPTPAHPCGACRSTLAVRRTCTADAWPPAAASGRGVPGRGRRASAPCRGDVRRVSPARPAPTHSVTSARTHPTRTDP